MINNKENKKVDIGVLISKDGSLANSVHSMLDSIAKTKLKGFLGDTMGSNYNTYEYSFNNDSMKVFGLTKDEPVNEFKLSEFIEELKRILG